MTNGDFILYCNIIYYIMLYYDKNILYYIIALLQPRRRWYLGLPCSSIGTFARSEFPWAAQHPESRVLRPKTT